jgi:hypothetical protein
MRGFRGVDACLVFCVVFQVPGHGPLGMGADARHSLVVTPWPPPQSASSALSSAATATTPLKAATALGTVVQSFG